jgi:alpha-mannosidase
MHDKTFGLVLANRQAAAVDFGDMGGFKTRFAPSEPTLISRLLMKCNQAGTRDQGVVMLPEIEPGADRYLRFEYSLTSGHRAFDPIATVHFGWGFNIPLLATFIEKQAGPLAQPSKSFFALDKPNVMLVDVKRADFGNQSDYILRLQEIAGLPDSRVTVHSAFPIKRAELDSLIEERVRDLPISPLIVPAGGHETVTLRLGF